MRLERATAGSAVFLKSNARLAIGIGGLEIMFEIEAQRGDMSLLFQGVMAHVRARLPRPRL